MNTLLQTADFEDVRHRMRPGDVIAFGGRGLVSWVIKLWTGSPVSHVGIVSRVDVQDGVESVRLLEATSLNGQCGVQETRLSWHIRHYDGEVWWLPLSDEIHEHAPMSRLVDAVYNHEGEVYDFWGSLRSPGQFDASTRKGRKFCSQLVAIGLRAIGVLVGCDPASFTPEDIVQLAIYAKTCYQLKGDPVDIPALNTVDPDTHNNEVKQ